MKIKRGTRTPWGPVQTYHKIAEGVWSVSTAGHGGIWLSDERTKELPDHYKSYAGDPWHEEDEDGGMVLQYLGLLSLIKEPLELEITEWDIELGKKTRKDLWGHCLHDNYFKHIDISKDGWIGGPIVEAYKRQTQDKRFDEMICSVHLAPRPGGFQLAKLCKDTQKFMKSFDCGKIVEPTTFTLQPFRLLERVEFKLTLKDGRTFTERVNGQLAQGVIANNQYDLELYLWLNKEIIKIEHENKTLWEIGNGMPIPETVPIRTNRDQKIPI